MKNVTLQTVSLTESVCLKATQHAILKQRVLFLISTQRDLFWLGEIGWHGNQYCVVHLMQPYLFSTLSAGRGKGGLCMCVCVYLQVYVRLALTLSRRVWNITIVPLHEVNCFCVPDEKERKIVWNETEETKNENKIYQTILETCSRVQILQIYFLLYCFRFNRLFQMSKSPPTS